MAVRPVYAVKSSAPFYSVVSAEFPWAGGFALSQSRKNIAAMHACFEERYPGKKALEISSKSEAPAGVAASAFNLHLTVPSRGASFPVECVFQSGKVFAAGGPFTDLIEASPKDAKRDPRLSSSGRLVCFRFEGTDYPLTPNVGFYDFIYIRALTENPDIANELLGFDAFTDIAFNPDRSRNCQARAAAVFVGLHRAGKLSCLASFDEFMRTVSAEAPHRAEPAPTSPVPEERPAAPTVQPGSVIIHKAFGKGTVTAVAGSALRIGFGSVGEKTLNAEWVMKNCEIVKE